MAKSLILYDGKMSTTERVATAIGHIVGNVRICEIAEAPSDISMYDGFCFIFNFYGALTAGKTKSFLNTRKEQLIGKRIAFVGLGFSDKGFTKYVVDMEFALGGDLSITGMFIENEKTTTEVGYQIAKKLREPVRRMDEAELMAEVGRFIEDHHVLVIATGTDDFVRATPLEYIYLNGVFYVITEGGLKYRSILENGNASVTIFDRFDGSFEHIRSLQIFGKAQPVKSQTKEYSEILARKGITADALDKMDVCLFVLRIMPLTIEFLNSDFTAQGYDARQLGDTEFRKQLWEQGSAFVRDSFENAGSAYAKVQSQSKESGLFGNEPETAGKKVSAASSSDRMADDGVSKEDGETGMGLTGDSDDTDLSSNAGSGSQPADSEDGFEGISAAEGSPDGETESTGSRKMYSAFDFGGELLLEDEEEEAAEEAEREPDEEEDPSFYEGEKEPVYEGLAAESRNMAEEVRRMMELRSSEDAPQEEEEEKKVPDEKELEEYRDLFGGVEDLHRDEVKKTPLIEREGRVDLREYLDEMDIDEEDPEAEEDGEEEEEEDYLERKRPKRARRRGFFATGFGKSLSRLLGIDDEEEDEDEDEDEDEYDDDEEDGEETYRESWMERFRARRDDEELMDELRADSEEEPDELDELLLKYGSDDDEDEDSDSYDDEYEDEEEDSDSYDDEYEDDEEDSDTFDDEYDDEEDSDDGYEEDEDSDDDYDEEDEEFEDSDDYEEDEEYEDSDDGEYEDDEEPDGRSGMKSGESWIKRIIRLGLGGRSREDEDSDEDEEDEDEYDYDESDEDEYEDSDEDGYEYEDSDEDEYEDSDEDEYEYEESDEDEYEIPDEGEYEDSDEDEYEESAAAAPSGEPEISIEAYAKAHADDSEADEKATEARAVFENNLRDAVSDVEKKSDVPVPAENEKIVEERVSQEAFEAVENAEPDEAAGISVIEEEIETPVIEDAIEVPVIEEEIEAPITEHAIETPVIEDVIDTPADRETQAVEVPEVPESRETEEAEAPEVSENETAEPDAETEVSEETAEPDWETEVPEKKDTSGQYKAPGRFWWDSEYTDPSGEDITDFREVIEEEEAVSESEDVLTKASDHEEYDLNEDGDSYDADRYDANEYEEDEYRDDDAYEEDETYEEDDEYEDDKYVEDDEDEYDDENDDDDEYDDDENDDEYDDYEDAEYEEEEEDDEDTGSNLGSRIKNVFGRLFGRGFAKSSDDEYEDDEDDEYDEEEEYDDDSDEYDEEDEYDDDEDEYGEDDEYDDVDEDGEDEEYEDGSADGGYEDDDAYEDDEYAQSPVGYGDVICAEDQDTSNVRKKGAETDLPGRAASDIVDLEGPKESDRDVSSDISGKTAVGFKGKKANVISPEYDDADEYDDSDEYDDTDQYGDSEEYEESDEYDDSGEYDDSDEYEDSDDYDDDGDEDDEYDDSDEDDEDDEEDEDEDDEERGSAFSAVRGWFGRLRERLSSDNDEDDEYDDDEYDDDEYDEEEDDDESEERGYGENEYDESEDDEYTDFIVSEEDDEDAGDEYDEEDEDDEDEDEYDDDDDEYDDEDDDEYDDDEDDEHESVFRRFFGGRRSRKKSKPVKAAVREPEEVEDWQDFDDMADEDVYFADLRDDERTRRSQRGRADSGRKTRTDTSLEDSYYSDIRKSSRYSESQYEDDLSMEELPDHMTIRGEDFTQMLRKAVRSVNSGSAMNSGTGAAGGRTGSVRDETIEGDDTDDGEIIPGSVYDASRGMTITGFDEDSENV